MGRDRVAANDNASTLVDALDFRSLRLMDDARRRGQNGRLLLLGRSCLASFNATVRAIARQALGATTRPPGPRARDR